MKLNAFQQWLVDHHPRVDLHWSRRHVGQCAAIKSSAPVRAYWKRDGTQQDAEVREQWRCSRLGWWKFSALPMESNTFNRSGEYCYLHLWTHLFHDMAEEEATERLMMETGYAKPNETITQKERPL